MILLIIMSLVGRRLNSEARLEMREVILNGMKRIHNSRIHFFFLGDCCVNRFIRRNWSDEAVKWILEFKVLLLAFQFDIRLRFTQNSGMESGKRFCSHFKSLAGERKSLEAKSFAVYLIMTINSDSWYEKKLSSTRECWEAEWMGNNADEKNGILVFSKVEKDGNWKHLHESHESR